MADRRFFADQSSPPPVVEGSEAHEGWIWKKGGGTRRMGRRSWNQRWCRMERRVLFVYSLKSDIQARSVVPLDGAEVRGQRKLSFKL